MPMQPVMGGLAQNALVFPKFNQHETLAVSALSHAEQRELARLLRLIMGEISDVDGKSD